MVDNKSQTAVEASSAHDTVEIAVYKELPEKNGMVVYLQTQAIPSCSDVSVCIAVISVQLASKFESLQT